MNAIYGIFGNGNLELLKLMGEKLSHRGTDVTEWSPVPRVYFGGRSFKINHYYENNSDIPLIANASLYNGIEIAENLELQGVISNPNSAEELIYSAYQIYKSACFQIFNGDFVIALWDLENERLVLSRDRLGSRSLYYWHGPDVFAFASEYKALMVFEEYVPKPDLESVQYLQASKYLLPGRTLMKDIHSIRSAHCLEVSERDIVENRYWNINMSPRKMYADEAQETLKELFLQSIQIRLASIKCLQAELSGGIDSSAVVAAMRLIRPNETIKTFTIGDDQNDPEIILARRIADQFGTDHHEIITNPDNLIQDLPFYVWHLEDPIGRTEGYLYFKLMEILSNQGSVIFGGSVSDALFAGMPRHKLVKMMQLIPLGRIPLEEFYHYTQVSSQPQSVSGNILKKVYFRGADAKVPNILGFDYQNDPKPLPRKKDGLLNHVLREGLLDGVQNSMAKTEKTHMAYGIEFRSPFTDKDSVEFSFKLTEDMKMHAFQEKYILRKTLASLLPKEVARRPKFPQRMAYNYEFSEVLDTLSDSYLNPKIIQDRGFFLREEIDRLRDRKNGKPYSSIKAMAIWTAILTEIWAQTFLDRRGGQITN
jgi:asparagine synthase (glutamine-hydrolysing)